MVGAPHVDHAAETAVDLVLVIGDVRGEVRVAPVRFHQRAVDVVAEVGGTEQCLLAILPILHRCALGRRQAPFVDVTRAPQRGDGFAHLIARALDQRALGKKHIVDDVERLKIVTDLCHHHVDGAVADDG